MSVRGAQAPCRKAMPMGYTAPLSHAWRIWQPLNHRSESVDCGGCLGGVRETTFAGQMTRPFLDRRQSRRILALAAPVIFAMLTQTGVNIVDTYFFGQLPVQESANGAGRS